MGNKVSAAVDDCGCYDPVFHSAVPESLSEKSRDPNALFDERNGPGSFQDLHKGCRDVFPTPFEGAKLIINKALTRHVQVNHSVQITPVPPFGSYNFGCTYVGDKKFGESEVYPVLTGEMDPSGNMNAQIVHRFNELTWKFISQIQNTKGTGYQVNAELKGSTYTASMSFSNIDILNGSGTVVAQFMQSLTKRFALGAEYLYQYGSLVPGGEVGIYTLASKYTGPNWVFAGCLTPVAGGTNLSYYQRASENLHIGVELQGSLRARDFACVLGYQVDLPHCGVVFRGRMDSNWSVSGVLEKKLNPLPFTMALSGFADHAKRQYKFGIGVTVGE